MYLILLQRIVKKDNLARQTDYLLIKAPTTFSTKTSIFIAYYRSMFYCQQRQI